MAKAHKESDPNLIEVYGGTSGRKLVKAVRKSGQIFSNGNIRGHVKAGLTVQYIADIWKGGMSSIGRVNVTLAGSIHSGPIVTEAKSKARKRAKERRQEKFEAQLAHEKKLLESQGLKATVIDALRRGWTPEDGETYYVFVMARFHGGAASYSLHGPMSAHYDLPDSADIKALDATADEVATELYGTNMAASKRWRRAFFGE